MSAEIGPDEIWQYGCKYSVLCNSLGLWLVVMWAKTRHGGPRSSNRPTVLASQSSFISVSSFILISSLFS